MEVEIKAGVKHTRRVLRDFIRWQLKNDLLKEPLTIDYELAEDYLDQVKHKG